MRHSKIYQKLPIDNKYGKFSDKLRSLKKIAGIYKIYEDGNLIYIGSSSNLYSRITRHFQTHEADLKEEKQGISRRNANWKNDIDTHEYTFTVIEFSGSYEDMKEKEAKLIIKEKPRDNKRKLYINLFTNEAINSIEAAQRSQNEQEQDEKQQPPEEDTLPDYVPF